MSIFGDNFGEFETLGEIGVYVVCMPMDFLWFFLTNYCTVEVE